MKARPLGEDPNPESLPWDQPRKGTELDLLIHQLEKFKGVPLRRGMRPDVDMEGGSLLLNKEDTEPRGRGA